ncbi:MAG: SIMPL domain-containing protein, partial [Christiangramia sp.]
MKKIFFALIIFSALPILAQQNYERPIVNVSGEGIVKVEPDEVLIKSRIEHEGSSAADVKRQNDEVVDKVIKYLKSQNIDEKDIQTEYLNLNKQYD